jgi:hypothetical protein
MMMTMTIVTVIIIITTTLSLIVINIIPTFTNPEAKALRLDRPVAALDPSGAANRKEERGGRGGEGKQHEKTEGLVFPEPSERQEGPVKNHYCCFAPVNYHCPMGCMARCQMQCNHAPLSTDPTSKQPKHPRRTTQTPL